MTNSKIEFRNLVEKDWPQVSRIYQEGLDSGNASFETDVPDWPKWDSNHIEACRLIAEKEGEIAGWAALSPVSSRCVYGGVAEVSVYVSAQFSGQQIGTQLLEKLIAGSEEEEIWTLQAGIFPENKASLKIHIKLGFREVGFREKIGKRNSVWRDTVLLERRSKNTGIN